MLMLSLLTVGLVVVSLGTATLSGQSVSAKFKTTTTKNWTPSRTPWGAPDLQGTWGNNNATPLERPKELAGRQFLTEEELAAIKRRAGELFNGDGDAAFGDTVFTTALNSAKGYKSRDGVTDDSPEGTGNYNAFWVVARSFDNRTSLITEPPDGRVPTLLAEAQQRQTAAMEYRKAHPADGPEDLPLSHRCVTFGLPNTLAGYNSYYQIVQTPEYVTIASEMIHDVRVIPLDGRPHVSSGVRQWLGDSRGHWEGNTLVVDTTNFTDKTNFRGAGANLHLVERFTRVGPNTLNWEFRVEDPTTFTRPWTAMIPLHETDDHIYEYACHEGNEGLAGALSGARALEKTPATAAIKGSR
jgi:hypothetical protein